MQIWRMKPEGSEQEQVTPDDGFNNWFPHLSPDGQRVVFLTYDKGVEGHPVDPLTSAVACDRLGLLHYS